MKVYLSRWSNDKLKTVLIISWLATVISSFFGVAVTMGKLPGIGELFPFRVFLPITVLIYLIWIIREKYNPWKEASYILRFCYVFCCILVVYGGLSLFWAMDIEFTFRRWFNLCIDLCFFFLALELGKDRRIFLYTIRCTMPTIIFEIVMGIYEVYSGGILFLHRDTFHSVTFFSRMCYWPRGTIGNPNDYSMTLVLTLALFLLYWVCRRHEEKCDWIPVAFIAPVYFLTCASGARLCMAALLIVLSGFGMYALTLEKKKRWILITTILLLGFVVFGCNYEHLTTDTRNLLEPFVVSAEATSIEPEQVVPLSDGSSFMDEFLSVNSETGEIRANQEHSAGIRLYLLMHALDCFVQSNGMGVGLGNTEQLAILSETNKSGIWTIHCFLARMTADFGIWFLIPLLLLVFELLRTCFVNMKQALKGKRVADTMMWVLYLTTLISYPIASTAPSDAQDSLVMWLFLAGIILFPMHMQKKEGE